MKKIIFQDIDGPFIPGRMYYGTGTTFLKYPLCHKWDPVAVDMVIKLCEAHDAKVVFNTAHNGMCDENAAKNMLYQAQENGLIDHVHPSDPCTKFPGHFDERISGIRDWLARHPEVESWVVIDDEPIPTKRLVHVHFEYGMTLDNYKKALMLLSNEGDPYARPYPETRAPELPSGT